LESTWRAGRTAELLTALVCCPTHGMGRCPHHCTFLQPAAGQDSAGRDRAPQQPRQTIAEERGVHNQPTTMMAIVLEHFFWDTLQSMFDGSDMWRCELVSRHWMAGTNLWPIAEPMPVGWGAYDDKGYPLLRPDAAERLINNRAPVHAAAAAGMPIL
jgi:hypothetical protein